MAQRFGSGQPSALYETEMTQQSGSGQIIASTEEIFEPASASIQEEPTRVNPSMQMATTMATTQVRDVEDL